MANWNDCDECYSKCSGRHSFFTHTNVNAYLAVMTGVSGSNNAMSVSMIRVRFHGVQSVVVMLLLLLSLLYLSWVAVRIESRTFTCDDANLLVVLV